MLLLWYNNVITVQQRISVRPQTHLGQLCILHHDSSWGMLQGDHTEKTKNLLNCEKLLFYFDIMNCDPELPRLNSLHMNYVYFNQHSSSYKDSVTTRQKSGEFAKLAHLANMLLSPGTWIWSPHKTRDFHWFQSYISHP